MSSLTPILLKTNDTWQFNSSTTSSFDRTFLINDNSENNLVSTVGKNYTGLTVTVDNISNFTRDTIANSSFYYDSNNNNILDTGEQLGYKLTATDNSLHLCTINNISGNGSNYHYILLTIDILVGSNRTIYFNFYDSDGVDISNSQMGYAIDTDSNSVVCSLSNKGIYMIPISMCSNLAKITIGFYGFSGITSTSGGVGVVFAGLMSSTQNFTSSNFPCFLENAMILTPTGEIKISDLKEGDKILDSNYNLKTVENLWMRDVYFIKPNDEKIAYPYVIKKDHFLKNVPNDDLYISPYHHVEVNNKLIESEDLNLEQEKINLPFRYYNISLKEGHHTMIANGCVVETFGSSGKNEDRLVRIA